MLKEKKENRKFDQKESTEKLEKKILTTRIKLQKNLWKCIPIKFKRKT